ncbi:MAG TPA: hypothetical protein VFO19_12325 [Vicinamibacterales bacterium]|jgi:hypothetical protein|nr:hypothetical protein [Vicinamibacterales bacterium]
MFAQGMLEKGALDGAALGARSLGNDLMYRLQDERVLIAIGIAIALWLFLRPRRSERM